MYYDVLLKVVCVIDVEYLCLVVLIEFVCCIVLVLISINESGVFKYV